MICKIHRIWYMTYSLRILWEGKKYWTSTSLCPKFVCDIEISKEQRMREIIILINEGKSFDDFEMVEIERLGRHEI